MTNCAYRVTILPLLNYNAIIVTTIATCGHHSFDSDYITGVAVVSREFIVD
jgi:hypothetical protein